MGGALLDGILKCEQHQCPMILVGENYVCLLEYTDSRLGQHQVRDLVPGRRPRHGKKAPAPPARLVFDNGLTLPLLCTCCGGPMHITHPDAALSILQGLYLVALAYAPATEGEDESLTLLFSPTAGGEPQEDASISVHLDSIRQMA